MDFDVDVGLTDVVLFVYNGAVVLSGAWIVNWGTLDVTPQLLGLVAIAAVVWTAYFNWQMAPRLAKLAGSDDGEDQEVATDGSGSDLP